MLKFSQYNLLIEMDYGLLVYNTKTTELVKLKNQELVDKFNTLRESKVIDINDPMVRALYEKDFIVDDSRNEFLEMKQIGKEKFIDNEKDISVLIHTTDKCNFKCVYCFKKQKPLDLSDDNWDNLYKYAKKKMQSGKTETICFAFYGGEPLLRFQQIVDFMTRINELALDYPATKVFYRMTTNGYLLTSDRYDILSSLGLGSLQITLDGFAETHDKTRPLLNGKGSWEKIVENLRYINTCNDDVIVLIRTNFNSTNIESLGAFDKWFNENFSKEKFALGKMPITRYSEMVDEDLVADTTDDEVIKILDSNDANKCRELLKNFGMACEYTKKGKWALSTAGFVSHCEEFTDDRTIVGYLNNDGDIVYNVDIEDWNNRLETEYCKECIMYPMCLSHTCNVKNKCYSVKERFDIAVQRIKEGKLF